METKLSTDHIHGANPEVATARAAYNNDRFNQLTTLLSSSTEGVWQYLLAVNGGAAAGILAFIGAVEKYRESTWAYWALALFMGGLILLGCARAQFVLMVNRVLRSWLNSMNQYNAGQIGWSEVSAKDLKQTNLRRWWPWVLGWSSFGSFICGVVLVALALARKW